MAAKKLGAGVWFTTGRNGHAGHYGTFRNAVVTESRWMPDRSGLSFFAPNKGPVEVTSDDRPSRDLSSTRPRCARPASRRTAARHYQGHARVRGGLPPAKPRVR